MMSFERLYKSIDLEVARTDLASVGWTILGRLSPKDEVLRLLDEIDRITEKGEPEINFGGSEYRVWMAHTKSTLIEKFKVFSDDVLSGVEQSEMEAIDVLAIRNRQIDYQDKFMTEGRWHLDSFSRQLKVFAFLSDVDGDCGPFEMLPKTHRLSFKIKEAIRGNYFSLKDFTGTNRSYSRLDESIIKEFENIGLNSKAFTVQAGTICVVDTSCVHRARPCKKGSRYALTSYYK